MKTSKWVRQDYAVMFVQVYACILLKSYVFRRFVNCMIYSGLAFNVGNMKGIGPYWSLSILGAVEPSAHLILYLTLDRVGRRWPLIISMLLTGVACLSTAGFNLAGISKSVSKFGGIHSDSTLPNGAWDPHVCRLRLGVKWRRSLIVGKLILVSRLPQGNKVPKVLYRTPAFFAY